MLDDFFNEVSEFSDYDNKPNMNQPVDSLPLAMAYVPMQKWRKLYDNDVGLDRGTLFMELDKPFLGKRATD